jgi:hypothetical protein
MVMVFTSLLRSYLIMQDYSYNDCNVQSFDIHCITICEILPCCRLIAVLAGLGSLERDAIWLRLYALGMQCVSAEIIAAGQRCKGADLRQADLVTG